MLSVSGVGRLTKDPEVHDAGGRQKVSFTLVSNRNYKKDDKWIEEPTFLDVVVWGGLTESALRFKKGFTVHVTGRLEQERWKHKESGENRSKYILNASGLQSIGNKRDEKEEKEESPF